MFCTSWVTITANNHTAPIPSSNVLVHNSQIAHSNIDINLALTAFSRYDRPNKCNNNLVKRWFQEYQFMFTYALLFYGCLYRKRKSQIPCLWRGYLPLPGLFLSVWCYSMDKIQPDLRISSL